MRASMSHHDSVISSLQEAPALREAQEDSLFATAAEATRSTVERMLVKTGMLGLLVKDINEALDAIGSVASRHAGEIYSTNISSDRFYSNSTVVVRVPSGKFDGAMSDLGAIAIKVERQVVNVEDVTETYIDLDARLKNMKAEEASYLKLLNRASKVENIIEITKELSRVRGDIESMQGKLNYLKNQAQLSTITISLRTEPSELAEPWGIWSIVKSSFESFVDGLKGFVSFIVKGVFILPVILLYVALIVLVYMVIVRLKAIYERRRNKGDGLKDDDSKPQQ